MASPVRLRSKFLRSAPFVAALAMTFGAVSVLSCSDEIVQTASKRPDLGGGGEGGGTPGTTFECLGGASNPSLPEGKEFGEGDVVGTTPLTLGSYAGSEGPGIFVAARDAYRLYLNGELLATGTGLGEGAFLPLSLLPGENVVALSVGASNGTPGVLVHLDELEKDIESDGTWKVSTRPSGEWRLPGFDDAAWANAEELGSFGAFPGCDPEDDFPSNSTARWIGPPLGTEGPVAFRKTIRIEPEGFAEGTTGGTNVLPRLVETFEEFAALANSVDPEIIVLAEGVHDFRRTGSDIESVDTCPGTCSNDAAKSVHQVLTGTDTCPDPLVTKESSDRIVKIGSDKTIVGLGRGALLRGVSFDLGTSKNVIVRNVAVFDVNPDLLEAGDAFTFTAPEGVWLDHVTVKWVSDAFTDMLAGTRGVTLSYVYFNGENEAECDNQDRWIATLTDTEASIHHSRFTLGSTRMPFVTGAPSRVHLWNNVYSSCTDWAVGAACRAEVLLEGSTFENTEAATRLSACADSADWGLIRATPDSNVYRDNSDVFLGGDGKEPAATVFEPPYEYRLDPAANAFGVVTSRAGAGGPWALSLKKD